MLDFEELYRIGEESKIKEPPGLFSQAIGWINKLTISQRLILVALFILNIAIAGLFGLMAAGILPY
ncbi:MAG: hypothetical protein ABFQ89_05585 [Chloroflexota bacterium]